MKLLKVWRALDFKGFLKGFPFVLKRPQLVFVAISATSRCIGICDTLYGKSHHRNNASNAFRHALWNILLIHKGLNWTPYPETATFWAKWLTDWHEACFPNAPLARDMDLHNNTVGRNLFNEFPKASEDQMIQKLLKLVTLSRKCKHIDELANHTGFLVHISD